MQWSTTAIFISTVFLKKAAVIITIFVQNTLDGQVNKVIPSGMYNCNFEAIN